MASFNKITIVGYIARDLEVSHTTSGKAVGRTSIATNRKYGDTETTTWFRLSIWGDRATKLEQYLTKGQQVFIEGDLTNQEYTDKEGNARTSLEVNVSDIQLIGSKGKSEPEAEASPVAPKAKKAAAGTSSVVDESQDIPF